MKNVVSVLKEELSALTSRRSALIKAIEALAGKQKARGRKAAKKKSILEDAKEVVATAVAKRGRPKKSAAPAEAAEAE